MDKFDDSNQSRIPVFVFPGTVYFNANDRDQIKQILTIYNPYDFPIRFKGKRLQMKLLIIQFEVVAERLIKICFSHLVLCTAPDLYTVIDPEGSIKPRNCVDLIVRVSSDIPSDSTNVLEHKFRVQIYHHLEKKVLGKRDVQAIIHFGNLPSHLALGAEASSMGGMSSSGHSFQQQSPSGFMGSGGGPGHSLGSSGGRDNPLSGSTAGESVRMGIGFLPQTTQPNYAVIFTAIVCLIGLMLPNSVEICNNNSSRNNGDPSSSNQLSSWIPASFHLTLHQKLLFAYTLGLVTMVIFRP